MKGKNGRIKAPQKYELDRSRGGGRGDDSTLSGSITKKLCVFPDSIYANDFCFFFFYFHFMPWVYCRLQFCSVKLV